MKILIIKLMAGAHPYSQFARALHTAISELGHKSVILDESAQAVDGVAPTAPLVSELSGGGYDAVVSFNSFFGSVLLQDGRSLFDALDVKFVGWLLDHPIYAPPSLTRELQNRHSIYSNHNHLRFAQAVKLPGRGITMLPGGAKPGTLRDYASREWPILVAGTYRGEPQRLWEELEDSPAKRLMTGVIDCLLADKEASLLEAFNETSSTLKLGARLGEDPAFDAQMQSFLREPLTYVRNIDRINIIRSLVDAGLPVAICGTGWSNIFGDRNNLTYIDSIEFEKLPHLYGRSKVVVNLNAGNGASERAIYAALAGATVASDYSSELNVLFGGSEGIAFFDRAKPETIAKVVGGLVEGGGGENIAHRGYMQVLTSGLWRHRAAELIDYISER
jgi:hypothetical protein